MVSANCDSHALLRSIAQWRAARVHEAVPAELRQLDQWVLWRSETRGGKQTKVPYTADGRHASSTDPTTWATFAEAQAARGGYSGVGFVFTPDDDFCGIDLDDCLDDDGELLPWAVPIVHAFSSYTEISPGLHGLKIWTKAKLPEGVRHKVAIGEGAVEVYDSGRYFTVTGRRWDGTPGEIAEGQEALDELVERYLRPASPKLSEIQERTATRNGKTRNSCESHPDDAALAAEAITHLSPTRADTYNEWLAVGMAARSVSDGLFSAWESFSRLSSKFTEGECAAKWRGFHPSNCQLGELITWARADSPGWRPSRPATEAVRRAVATAGPVLVCMADVEPKQIDWMWLYRIPLGRITLFVGRPGEGKSIVTTDMAARVSTGFPWPDGSPCPEGSVIFICAEDDPADTIAPRLIAHGANMSRVHLLSMVRRVSAEGEVSETLFCLEDVAALEAALQRLPDCKLIVVDPIGSFLGGSTDAHRDNEVRAVLAPVAKLAEKYGPAVLVVAHRRKAGGTNADDLALGSRAFTGLARVVWHLSRDRDQKDRRLFLPGKNNLAREGDGLAFTICGDPPAIKWEQGPVRQSADDALANDADKPGPEPEARQEAERWLKDVLKDGPVLSAEVKKQATDAGISWRTTRRAADRLRVRREKCGFTKGWQWRLLRVNAEAENEVGHDVGHELANTKNMDNRDNMDTLGKTNK